MSWKSHFFYNLRQLSGSPKLLIVMLLLAGFTIFFFSFQFIYPFALLIGAIFAIRGLIGRRCPLCDAPLKETRVERDKTNAFVLYVIWRCPHDGYEEKEKTRGDAGLFGAS